MKKLLLLLVLFSVALFSYSFTKHPSRNKTSIASVSRSLVYPVAGNRSRLEDKWGASRAGGIRRHKGIDIHARRGTPVVAVCDGIITEKGRMPVGGKTLWLKSSAYGWTAYYAHLDKQYVKEGQRVRKGQVIGTVGNTGNARSTPAHLHYGIDNGSGWVNPLPYVKYSPKVVVKATARKKASARSKKRTIKAKSR